MSEVRSFVRKWLPDADMVVFGERPTFMGGFGVNEDELLHRSAASNDLSNTCSEDVFYNKWIDQDIEHCSLISYCKTRVSRNARKVNLVQLWNRRGLMLLLLKTSVIHPFDEHRTLNV